MAKKSNRSLQLKTASDIMELAKELYKPLVEASPDMIFKIGKRGQIEFLNPFAAKLLKANPQSLIGKPLKTLFPSEMAHRQWTMIQKIFKTGQPSYHEENYDFLPTKMWLGTRFDPIKNEKGKIISVIGVSRDITDRIEIQRQISASEQKYHLIADNSSDLIWTASFGDVAKILSLIKKHGKKALPQVQRLCRITMTYVSPAAKKMYGYTPEVYLKRTIQSTMTSESYQYVMEVLLEELFLEASGKGDVNKKRTLQLEEYRKDGSLIPTELSVSFLRDVHGQPVGIIGVTRDITERKMNQEELLKFKLAIQQSADAIFIADIKGNIIFINPAFTQLYGYTEKEILGKNPRVWKTDRYDKKFYKSFWKTILSRKTATVEFTNKRKDGKPILMASTVSPIAGADGVLIGFLATQRDVTREKAVESRLRESEAQYRDIVENSPEMIHSVDAHDRLIFVNRCEYELLGYSKTEMLGMHMCKIYGDSFCKIVKQGFETLKKTGTLFVPNGVMFKKNGEKIDVEINSIAIYDSQGRFLHTRSIIRDVTERHKVGVALQESENKYRNLVDNALVGIFTTTLKGDILYANRSICTILDFPSVKEFIKTKAPTRYKNPEDRKHFLELLQKNGKVSDFEVTLLTRKGHEKQVVMSAALEGDTLSGMMMDITQRKVAEKDLHQKVEQMEFMSRLNLKRYEKMMEQQRDIIKLKRALGQEPPSLEEIHQLFSDLKS